MKRAALLLALAAAPGLAAAPTHRTGAHRPAAPAARDWSRTVAATPEGGFRMGNPSAPVKLVEYGSLTCPHCAAFAHDGVPQLLARYVRTGKVSWEFRNFVLNGIDITASLLARCAGPRGFFPMADTLYATQPKWMGRIIGLPQAEKDKLATLPDAARLVRLAEVGGFPQVAARYGVPAPRARQCLTDPAGFERLGKMHAAGQALGVPGTPTFFVNGTMVDGIEWAQVEPALRRAGA
jgi:protein-disulfide isomerase